MGKNAVFSESNGLTVIDQAHFRVGSNWSKGDQMSAFRIFTIESGSVRQGAIVEKLTLKGAQTDIPAILIGEEGRGRQRGVLPVTLTALQQKEWSEKGYVTIQFAETGTSQSGKPKLIARESGSDEKIIAVFRTKIGFRGGNSHTGDRNGKEEYSEFGLIKTRNTFAPFPGEKIVEGRIAQGTAGGMGSGEQFVAILPKDVWFRTAYSGRLYDAPGAHYYRWDGKDLSAMTWDERQTLEALVEEVEESETSSMVEQPTSSLSANDGADEKPAESIDVKPKNSTTVTISIELLNRLIAGNSDMDAVWEAAALLPKS